MAEKVYLPVDDFEGAGQPNLDIAADFLELSAFFSDDGFSLVQSIVDASDLAAADDFKTVEEEITRREEVASGAAMTIHDRKRALGSSYPFEISNNGTVISCELSNLSFGRVSYLVSLVLSNLRSMTPLLSGSEMHPTNAEVSSLRQYFQYFATAALAAEVGGQAWSFGFPRPDHTDFLTKLKEVWGTLQDGTVSHEEGEVPLNPKDDEVDVFAARVHVDGLPGFLFAVAQVATGANWRSKSLRSHLDYVFFQRWFSYQPSTPPVPYHIVPFALPRVGFRDHVRLLGNVLHRLRVPLRVDQADALDKQGIVIEAYDELECARNWVVEYATRQRTRKTQARAAHTLI